MLTRRGMIRGSAALAITSAAATMGREARPAMAAGCQILPPASPAVVALNRLSFGPRAGDQSAFNALGATPEERYEAWVTRQLNPASIDDSACAQRLTATKLKIRYGAVNEARTLGMLDAPLATLWPLVDHAEWQERIRPYEEVRVATWVRAVYSQRQLFEVLVDFWHNHFNVRASSDGTIMTTWPLYDRIIRTHALGRFRTFVEEVGRSIAMMLYLDNASNRASGGEGGNENYARELFELHTLGSDHYLKFYNDRGQIPTITYGGKTYPTGYIDDDVYEASRCLTGWTIANGRDGRPDTGDFLYRADWHDTYPKTVLAPRPMEGVAPAPNIPARQAELKDGQDVFDLVCNHPGTARHLCTKLARRLIADTPPASVIDAAVEVWMANRDAPDQIAQVVGTILRSRECRTTYGRKVRRPLETVWAYLRATGAELPSDVTEEEGDPGRGGYWNTLLYRADLTGHRLFGWETPNGHPDLASYWANTNGVLRRWNMFYTITQSWGGNVKIELLRVPDLNNKVLTAVPSGQGPDIIAWVNDQIGKNVLAEIIQPLDDYGINEAYLRENFTPVAADAMIYDGAVYGIPESMEALTFIYNRALISEADLPANTDELIADAQAYNAADKYLFVYNGRADAYFSAPWWQGSGVELVRPDGTTGINSPEGVAAGELIQQFSTIMPPEIDYGIADTLFKEGKAAIILNGPWSVADYLAAGIDVGLATIPVVSNSGTPGTPFVGVKMLMLANNAKQPEAAAELMKFYGSTEVQAQLAEVNKQVPANAAAQEQVASDPIIAGFIAQAANGKPLPNTEFIDAMWDPIAQTVQAIWTGSTDPATAVADGEALFEEKAQDLR